MPEIPIPNIVVDATGNAAVVQWLAKQSTGIQAPLALGVNASATAFTLDVGNWQPLVNTLIGIESEVCLVTAKLGGVLTVTRGRGGTAAAPHAQGVMVRELKYQSISDGLRDQIVQFIRQQIAGDAAINAGVTAATAARDVVVQGAVT